MDTNCYETYDEFKEKRQIIEKGSYLLNSKCCNTESCEKLINDIQDTKFICNDIFGKNIHHELDEKGNIIGDTLCSKLNAKQKEVTEVAQKFKIGGKTKTKRKRRYIKRNKRRTKKYRKY